jgi:hypothetical protein
MFLVSGCIENWRQPKVQIALGFDMKDGVAAIST